MSFGCLRLPLASLLTVVAVPVIAPLPASADTLVYVKSGYVYLANPNGSSARAVTPQSGWWKWPSESDNGTIAVAGGAARVNSGGSTESSGSSEIYAFDQHGHSLLSTPVNTPGSYSSPAMPTYVNHFRISPDGTTVAYNVLGCCGASGESTFLSPLQLDLLEREARRQLVGLLRRLRGSRMGGCERNAGRDGACAWADP